MVVLTLDFLLSVRICKLSISLYVGLDHTHTDLMKNYVSNVI